MDDKHKKIVKMASICLCLAATAIIFFISRPMDMGLATVSNDETVLMKCQDSTCGTIFQMGKRDYFKAIEDATSAGMMATPALTCTKCKRKSAMRAVKCEKCGTVFLWDSVPRDYPDRCTKCGYSKIEKGE